MNGAYDPDGDALTYSLTLPPLFTSTKTEDILPNENFTLKVDLSHAVNVTVPILVAVEDTYGDTDDTLINVKVLPNNQACGLKQRDGSRSVQFTVGTPIKYTTNYYEDKRCYILKQ